jgi:hypothetical protein
LTRILIFYEYLFFARHAAVSFLLGKEEKLLRATLHTVHVIVHMEEGVGVEHERLEAWVSPQEQLRFDRYE